MQKLIGLIGFIMLAGMLGYSVYYTKTCERYLKTDIIINGETGKAELGQVSYCK